MLVQCTQKQLALQYAAAAATTLQQQQQQPRAHAAVPAAQQENVQPEFMAVDHAQLTGSVGGGGSFPPLSPADVGAWWLDDSTLHFMARFNQLDEPLVLTVDAEPVTLSFDEVRDPAMAGAEKSKSSAHDHHQARRTHVQLQSYQQSCFLLCSQLASLAGSELAALWQKYLDGFSRCITHWIADPESPAGRRLARMYREFSIVWSSVQIHHPNHFSVHAHVVTCPTFLLLSAQQQASSRLHPAIKKLVEGCGQRHYQQSIEQLSSEGSSRLSIHAHTAVVCDKLKHILRRTP